MIGIHFYLASQWTVINQSCMSSFPSFNVSVKAVIAGVHLTANKPSIHQLICTCYKPGNHIFWSEIARVLVSRVGLHTPTKQLGSQSPPSPALPNACHGNSRHAGMFHNFLKFSQTFMNVAITHTCSTAQSERENHSFILITKILFWLHYHNLRDFMTPEIDT